MSVNIENIYIYIYIYIYIEYACQPGTQILPIKRDKNYAKCIICICKCIRFCPRLDKMQHISLTKFTLINWLLTNMELQKKDFSNNTQVFHEQLFVLFE